MIKEMALLNMKMKQCEEEIKSISKRLSTLQDEKRELENAKIDVLTNYAQPYVDAINDILKAAKNNGIAIKVTTKSATYTYDLKECSASYRLSENRPIIFFSN